MYPQNVYFCAIVKPVSEANKSFFVVTFCLKLPISAQKMLSPNGCEARNFVSRNWDAHYFHVVSPIVKLAIFV